MITIQELLLNRGLPQDAKVKLVRHIDPRFDLHTLYTTRREIFLRYQSMQANDVFKGCDYIVSFVGEENSTARFVGVFRIVGKTVGIEEFASGNIAFNGNFTYTMEEVDGFADLSEHVVVRWNNPRAWHQWIDNPMEVIEISPGLHYRMFADYLDLILSFHELREIVRNGYKDWRIALSSVKGVYLITDISTGKLYVGSAYGDNGIWGRWCDYVSTSGHGGNKLLLELTKSDPDYALKNFRFSILMLLPKTITPQEAIHKETLFKRKLGSNAFGLNEN